MSQVHEKRPDWDDRPPSRRSFFWPVLLIGIGVVLLLSQLGLIATISWGLLIRFWPVLLIVAGLDLLFGRRAPILGSLMGVLVLVIVLAGLAWAPAVGWFNLENRSWTLSGLELPIEVRHSHYEEAIDGAREARITLDLGSFPSEVGALSDDELLFEADVDHLGQMRFETSGQSTRDILLDEVRTGISFTNAHGNYRWGYRSLPRAAARSYRRRRLGTRRAGPQHIAAHRAGPRW